MKNTPSLLVSFLPWLVLAGCTSPLTFKSERQRDAFGPTASETVSVSVSGTFGGQPPSSELPAPVGFHMTSVDADLERVARIWERELGTAVTVAERAKDRKVSVAIVAPSKDELRRIATASLRANGIAVVERGDGVVFDLMAPMTSN